MKNNIKLFLSKYPQISNIIRFTMYLVYRYIINFRWRRFKLKKNVSFVNIPLNINKSSFFGYYNISPWNNRGDILFYETSGKVKRASLNAKLEIKIYKSNSNRVKSLSKTNAWNWQQGCMLQWYANSNDEIIYNNYDEIQDIYFSEILNIESEKTKRICKPVYSVSKDGNFALTLNFNRLAEMRPDYGYFNKSEDSLFDDKKDGIFLIDIKSNDYKLIISLEDLKNFKPVKTMVNSRHWVNHIDISPNGKRFMFLHRWIKNKKKYHRLLTSDIDGRNLFYITGDEIVSHNCWLDSKNIISFCRLNDGRLRYNYYKDKKGFVKIIGVNDFLKDGHPSISPDGKWMLTDEYPDKSRFSSLYLYDLINEKKYIVGEFYQPFKYKGEIRIDLHPKWSKNGHFISIDSGHNGRRCLYVINVFKCIDNV